MSQLRDCVKYFQDTFRARNWKTLTVKPENIIIGETKNFISYDLDNDFPRIETLIWHSHGREYEGTLARRRILTLQVGASIYREKENIEEEDFFKICDFGDEIAEEVYNSHVARRLGDSPCEGFDYIGAYPIMNIEDELGEQITTVIYQFDINLCVKNP